MKVRIVTVDLELTSRQRRIGTLAMVVAVAAGASVAIAMVPKQFAAGEVLKAADLNANFTDLDTRVTALEAKTFVEARIADALPLTFPAGTLTKVTYGTENDDTLSEYDPASGTFTAKSGGTYSVCVGFYGAQFTEDFELDLFVAGARDRAFLFGAKSLDPGAAGTGCTLIGLDVGDTLDVRLFHDEPASASVTGAPIWDVLTITRL